MKTKLKSLLLYDGLESKEIYESVEADVREQNGKNITLYSGIMFFVFALLFTVSFFVEDLSSNRGQYAISFILSLLIFCLMHLYGKKHMRLNAILTYAFTTMMLGFAIIIGTVNEPSEPAIAFCVMIAIFSFWAYDTILRSLVYRIIMITVFIIFAFIYKDRSVVWTDIVDICFYGTLGVVIGSFNQKVSTSAYYLRRNMNNEIVRQTERLEELNKQAIFSIVNAVDLKDRYTKGHSNRVANYSAEIAKRMGKSPKEQNEIYFAGLLHDVGKIGIDNAIINKTSRLTDVEYETMKLHPNLGYQIVKNITSNTGMADGAKWHHERYDGKGYPDKLSGNSIPEIARIIAVADVYDSMTSNRSYRDTMDQAKVREEFERCKGSQFDPEIADIMLSMIDDDKDFNMRQHNPKKKSILVIDDDRMCQKQTSRIVDSVEEYTAIVAGSAKEGINIIMNQDIQLVLLDLRMPEIDGFEAYQMIRNLGFATPIIFLTGDNDLELIEKARGIGAEDYIVKPVRAQAMLEIVHAVLEREEQEAMVRMEFL